ncbi:unnamed protein product [Acanthoscelides obtectus]|uniref:BAT2 N-terminal domain-containing protein n=1 Tax=Acanthoscelides obtectus TaxID=200917 RepID=A0A9P0KKA8_ACAOB|nr:unnamed protein product [Acanthoscelides obtectus]CAK1665359.1 Protein PRRC2A [Acanthoscelides obtectus]
MSTLPGQASKGEKTKQKFQSLDINSLYRVSRGENLEKTQQKSSSTYIKHGMQSLGKVPNARRAPANLPSLKAEHSGSDAAVPLVPAGSPGWGKQEQPSTGGSPPQSSSAAAPSQQQNQQQNQTGQQPQPQQQQNQLSSHQQAIALPVSAPAPPHIHKPLGSAGSASSAASGGGDKLWSSVMGGHPDGSGGSGGHPPLYQSVQFQHEFPSLEGGGVPPARTPDGQAAYAGATQPGGGGLSLRPQTEGSWTQGGQRGGSQHGVGGVGIGVGVENGPAVGGVGPRGVQGPLSVGGSGGPPQLPAQVGMRGGPGGAMPGAAAPPPVEQPFPPQIRGVMPPFMCKGSNFQQGPVGAAGMGSQSQQHMQQGAPSSQQQRMNGGRQQPPRMADGRGEQEDSGMPSALLSRPIIKEEELSRMDEIGRDMGWAESGEIDYNQKLAFSDDEADSSKPMPKRDSLRRQQSLTPKDPQQHQEPPQSQGQSQGPAPSDRGGQWARGSRGGRSSVAEEEELRAQQRRTQTEREVELAVQRAKQRKEEEEKRFQEERKQGAQKKLMELEEKIQKRASDSQEKSSSLPPQMDNVDIPLPDFQKEKERDKDGRAKTPNDIRDDKNQDGSFRHMAQIEGKGGFPRKHQKGPEREREREQNAYPRSFQYDLPPRFKNQRNNSSSNLQANAPYHQWSGGQNAPKGAAQGMQNRNSRQHSPDTDKEVYSDDRREYKRQSSEDSYRSSHSHHSQQDLQKIPESKRYSDEPQDSEPAFKSQYNRKEEDNKWHKDMKDDWDRDDRRSDKREDKYERERPHRPDSRDSRSTRHSRDSDSRNEYNWGESAYEHAYEEKKKDDRIDRRPAVPGPITKERIEADDQRGNEKRALTQLKKGANPEKVEKNDDADSWADLIEQEEARQSEAIKKQQHDHRSQQSEQPQKKSDDYSSNRNRSYPQKKNWNSGPSDYHPPRSQLWSKGARSGSRHKGGKDYHPGTTDSDASAEEHAIADQKIEAKNEPTAHKSQRSPKPVKKFDKDDKNKENKQEKMTGEQKKQDKPEKRDNYIPRGEPSRHGRGGGAFRSGGGAGGRMGGLGKRFDGYGPPPSKSPFSSSHPHEDTKDKKSAKEETGTQQASTTDNSSQQQHASSTAASTSTTTTTTTSSSEDKIKQQQQALAAGIIGKKAAAEFVAKDDEKPAVPAVTKSGSGRSDRGDRGDRGGRQDIKRGGPKGGKGRDGDAIPEGGYDDRNRDKNRPQGPRSSHSRSRNEGGRNNQTARLGGNEKRSYDRNRQNSSSSLRKDDKHSEHNAASEGHVKDSEHEEKDEKTSVNGDSEGFQEVKSKKNLKERQKSMDEKPSKNGQNKDVKDKDVGKDKERDNRRNKNMSQLTAQQQQQLIQNIPPLMGTPVNPPAGMTSSLSQQPPPCQSSKNQFDGRPRPAKLAPRFAKQKLKAQMQQHGGTGSGGGIIAVGDMAADINKGLNVYGMKDSASSQASVSACAWDKPLGSQLRNLDHDNVIGVSIDHVKGLDAGQPSPQGASPNSEKLQDKPLLDGATPPVNTIIFENTNFKQAPGARSTRTDSKPRTGPVGASTGSGGKLEESATSPGSVIDGSAMMGGFNKAGVINELLQNKDTKSDGGIQLPLFKEDSADMKLDFFGSDLQFSSSDDKGKNLCMTKSIHAIASGNNTVDSLDIKIASVKKVWETSEQESEEMSFVGPPLDSNVFNQNKDASDEAHHHHDAYTSSPNQSVSTTTNVCKVKPTQQVSGGTGTGGTGTAQTVLGAASGGHGQQHSGGGGAMVAPGLMGNPLSPPPPMPQVLGAAAAAAAAAGVGLGPQQYTTNQHMGYQASLSGSTQYGIPAIPSPPTVPLVYGQSTQQQLQAAAAAAHQTAAAGLYGAFQIDQIGQGRSQFSQYPSAYHAHGGLGQTASSPYTTQSVYLQAGPPHAPPPPTAATAQAPPPDLYSNYRLSAAFGQGGQLSNPSTMLISSTTNSLMSASSVKPAGGQTISAIGTKAGGVGQAFQPSPAQQSAVSQQSQQQQQQQQQQVAYAMYDPSIAAAAANYLAAGGPGMRGGPPSGNPSSAAVQNSVAAAAAAAAVQGLQPSSSYYSGSTSQTGYFQQPGNSSMQSTQQLSQHQAGYGLQGNVFGSHGQSHTGTGLQSYNSHFLTTPMQVAAALNAQQFRSGLPAAAAAAAYMKGVAGQQMGDQATRAQQLKSPGSQEVLSSVFNTGPQIPSPKSRQNMKQPPPQSSPTAQQKYNLYQAVGNQQNPNIQRYPPPIQRPVNYQQMQQNNSVNQKHRSGNPGGYKAPNRQYYGGQSK